VAGPLPVCSVRRRSFPFSLVPRLGTRVRHGDATRGRREQQPPSAVWGSEVRVGGAVGPDCQLFRQRDVEDHRLRTAIRGQKRAVSTVSSRPRLAGVGFDVRPRGSSWLRTAVPNGRPGSSKKKKKKFWDSEEFRSEGRPLTTTINRCHCDAPRRSWKTPPRRSAAVASRRSRPTGRKGAGVPHATIHPPGPRGGRLPPHAVRRRNKRVSLPRPLNNADPCRALSLSCSSGARTRGGAGRGSL